MTIAGYAGDVMEPFCAPDGTLFYNTRNGAGDRPELRYATLVPGGGFVDRGVVAGTESSFLNGVPSIDRARELFSSFAIDASSSHILAAVNADGLAYARTISEDRRALFFTRRSRASDRTFRWRDAIARTNHSGRRETSRDSAISSKRRRSAADDYFFTRALRGITSRSSLSRFPVTRPQQ